MAYRITTQAAELLGECIRCAVVGWSINDPVRGRIAQRIHRESTTILGFSFSRFVNKAVVELGVDYRPKGFPLSLVEASALANDLENGFATPAQIHAASVIAAHSPCCQPAVGSRQWHIFFDLMEEEGVCAFGSNTDWSNAVRVDLAPFCRAVAGGAAHV